MLKTPFCELFGIEHPIVQGGMVYLGSAELVSAVSNAGGLGMIGTGGSPSDWLKEQIRITRMLTDRPFGVNIMLMSPYVEQITEVAVKEKVQIVSTGGGNPERFMSKFKAAGIKVMPVVSTVSLAKHMEELGADAVVSEGMESGGHIGETTTMVLVPQVVDTVNIPVIAAGGIADGRGLVAALALGAQGIQMGMRFICSEECIAHRDVKKKIIEANDSATEVVSELTGHPIRYIKNSMTRKLLDMGEQGALKEDLIKASKGKVYAGLINGDIEEGLLMAGQIAGLIKEVKPAGKIIEDIITEAESIIAEFNTTQVYYTS